MAKPGARAQAIELLALGQMNQAQVADAVGVHYHTVGKWQKDRDFINAVIERSRDLLREALPSVYSTLISEAQQGHHQHVAILLKHVEKLEEQRTNAEMGQITFTWRSGSSTQPRLEAL